MPFAIQLGNRPGYVLNPGTTHYYALGGASGDPVEVRQQTKIYNTLTLRNLLIYVRTNTIAAASTFRTRLNGANGALSVSVGAGVTGEFEDIVNSDALVNGDYSNYMVVVGAGGVSLRITIVSCTLENATNVVHIPVQTQDSGETIAAGTNAYVAPSGDINASRNVEVQAQFTIRFTATWDRLRVYVSANNSTNGGTVRSRINGAYGNLSISIGAGATGEFEDIVNNDALVAGNQICTELDTAAGVGGITYEVVQTRITTGTPFSQFLQSSGNKAVAAGLTTYFPIAGDIEDNPEAITQGRIRGNPAPITGRNLFVRLRTNTVLAASTVRTRVNGANGNLSVSIGAGATGAFKDIAAPWDTLANGDLYNYQAIVGAGGVQIILTVLSVTLEGLQTTRPSSGSIIPLALSYRII